MTRLLAGLPDYRIQNLVRDAVRERITARVVDYEDSLVDVQSVNPAMRVEIVDSSTNCVVGERDGTMPSEVLKPEVGGHCDIVFSHVLKDEPGTVVFPHGVVVSRHSGYSLRHPAVASRFRHTILGRTFCLNPLAKFMTLRCYGASNDHAPGSQRVHTRREKEPALPIQRESGNWSIYGRPIMNNDTRRLKRIGGTKRSTDAVEAPAPRVFGRDNGASAVMTAANHARTEQAGSPISGGDWRVAV